MKIIKKFCLVFLLTIWFGNLFIYAQDYILFYGNGCPHCAKVEKFFEDNGVLNKFDLTSKEVYFNKKNLTEFQSYLKKLNLDSTQIWVPFLVVNNENECSYINWDESIIEFFKQKIEISCTHSGCDQKICNEENCQWLKCEGHTLSNSWLVQETKSELKERLKFLWIMLPAALSDSINPCEFAVMLLLLSTILTKTRSKKKALLSWFLFIIAVFISYFSMGLWLFSALASATNTDLIKRIVWILWIVVWLANLKDFFRYGKGFVMEVPFSWRPKMASLIEKIASPIWAFIVWFIVSVFLLPCTSGPYFTILGYLASESKNINIRWYIYLLIYNIVFVLPMIVIALLVGLGYKSAEELNAIKEKNTKLIHFIVWLLMLGLWIYVLLNI